MKQLDPIVLKPTRYTNPPKMIREYRQWFLGNASRKTEFTDRVDFLRTAAIGRFLMFWMLADYMEDFRVIQRGKMPMRRVLPD